MLVLLAALAQPDVAIIRNSGSTNTQAYTIVLHADGAAEVTVGDETTYRRVAHPQTAWLFRALGAALPLDALPAPHCMRSASFGSTTTIAFGGQRTPDLNCSDDPATRELARTAGVIVDQLGIRLFRKHTFPTRGFPPASAPPDATPTP